MRHNAGSLLDRSQFVVTSSYVAKWRSAFCLLIALLVGVPAFAEDTPPDGWLMVLAPENAFHASLLHGKTVLLETRLVGWGAGWAYRDPPAGAPRAKDHTLSGQAAYVFDKVAGDIVPSQVEVEASGADRVHLSYSFDAPKDIALTQLSVILMIPPLKDGIKSVTVKSSDGTTAALTVPLSVRPLPENVSDVDLVVADGKAMRMHFQEPVTLAVDSDQLRIVIAAAKFAQGHRAAVFDIQFPAAVTLPVTDADRNALAETLPDQTWFAFTPDTATTQPSVIGMEAWLDKPAGKRGGVRVVGDHFELADRTPIQFWGTNLAYSECAPTHDQADAAAAHLAHYGVNAVRLHKFLGPDGWEGFADKNDATKFVPAGLERFDYFCSKLAENGIYYGLSHTYGFIVEPGNRDRLLAYDEIAKFAPNRNTYALINIAPDIQDLIIERTVNLLNHANPYTQKKYADDPAVAYIEFHNEDDIFFFSTAHVLQQCPTYRAAFEKRFGEWLKDKYKTRDALKAAWGTALQENESWDGGRIAVVPTPWLMSDDSLRTQRPDDRVRTLDNAAFFHAEQNKFYKRFEKAIRDTGYQGPLVGSCWQAPAMTPHYYNLRSDYLTGVIDRHNYFGGGLLDSMLNSPGSGYLGSGLQQVVDRPFTLSEWITVYPSLYSADGPAIVAAYGLGLQGWDGSYEFTSHVGRPFAEIVATPPPFGVWTVDVPTQLGQYPTLARMVYRRDVKPADVISTRRVSLENIAQAKYDFSDKISQTGDVKSFTGSASAVSLAIGRAVVEFVEHSQPSTFTDLSAFIKDNALHSTTGQLTWYTSGRGFFTIDTPGTKGVVGFAQGQPQNLGGFGIDLKSPYASIILTAAGRDETLPTAGSAILSVVARNSNTGFTYFKPTLQIIDNGKAPVLLEPVQATIRSEIRHIASVNFLDALGCRTGTTAPVLNNGFEINGTTDKAIYYEIIFAN